MITGNIRNRGNKKLSKQSNYSVLQGIKVGSAEEHNQYILIPQRVSQQVSTLSSREATIKSQGSWVSSIRYQHSPATHILDKHPRQSWSKDCSPAAYQHSKESLPQHIKTSPEESNPIPQEIWNSHPQAVSISPVDSGSLSSQSMNASPGFI